MLVPLSVEKLLPILQEGLSNTCLVYWNHSPVRGQILLARAPQINTKFVRHGKDYETYIILRPCSNGNVVLGGFMQKNNGAGDTFAREADSIWQRTSTLEPSLHASGTEVLATFAGLRPGRQGGARIELEERQVGRIVVHNYGAGGTGYQAGLGMAMEATSALVEGFEGPR